MRLSGKRTIVTGGARGIGLAIAARASAEGAHVVTADLAQDEGRPWKTIRPTSPPSRP